MSQKNIYTIDPQYSFVDALASGLLKRLSGNPHELSRYLILLPNRRSCRNLRLAFIRQAGGTPILLPTIRAIGDGDDSELMLTDPELFADIKRPISAVRRAFLLARHIQEEMRGRFTFDQSISLAGELGNFLDEMQRNEIPLAKLSEIIPEELSEYWQETLDFLSVLSTKWPSILIEESAMDIIERRNQLIRLQAKIWRKNEPDFPIIAAGSTGSTPASSELLYTIAELSRGEVILPGIDKQMDEEQWENVEPHHPQYALKLFIDGIRVNRKNILEWKHGFEENVDTEKRSSFIREIMRPAKTVSKWIGLELPVESVKNISLLELPSLAEESTAIALMLRQQVEEKDKTAALVTNDRNLATRVAGILERWNIKINDSAGIPLGKTQSATFFCLVAEMFASRMAPIPLLSALKHPLCGLDNSQVNQLEKIVLRGPRVGNGLEGIHALLLQKEMKDLASWVDALRNRSSRLERIFQKEKVFFAEILSTHLDFSEEISWREGEDGPRLWSNHESGEDFFKFCEELLISTEDMEIDPLYYVTILKGFLAKRHYWPREDAHPRLAILSPMEARLRHYDLMILGELNHGSWPYTSAKGWMSKQIRELIGLPSEEFSQGLSAHDFTSFLYAPRVIITRAEKVGKSPSIASSWWLRMETVLQSSRLIDSVRPQEAWLEWSELLNQPEMFQSISRPAPKPPLSARPRTLWVTQIEKLMRDPYGVYAREILGLRPLKEIDEDPDGAEFGSIIHKALENFTKGFPEGTYEDLLRCGEEVFDEFKHRPSVKAIWWPRFEKIAEWFMIEDIKRKTRGVKILAEQEGSISWESAGGTFILKARADRIEMAKDGTLSVIDYKTGSLPEKGDIEKGYAPQITLEGLMAERKGFPDIFGKVDKMACWHLNVGESLGKVVEAKVNLDEVDKNIKRLISEFDNPEAPYAPCPDAKYAPRYNDFAHLERIKEYS